MYRNHNPISNLEFILQGVFGTSLASLGGDVQVDEEKTGEESSKKNSQVSTELNLKGQGGGRKSLNNGVHGESRGRKSGNRNSSGSALCEGGLGN